MLIKNQRMKQFKSNNKEFLVIEQGKFEELAKGILREDYVDNKLKFVLVTNDFTEKEAALVVEYYFENETNPHEIWFKNYLSKRGEFEFEFPKESFQSLMESIDCPIVNKYDTLIPKREAKWDENFKEKDCENFDKWQLEESKIKTYIILEKKQP